ncbi:hypothetical protein QWI17_22100 [Gilvimarinus sp. SDUM040013]|uniref:Beta-xylosidase C-terminal Concanavalin A-like domain-containing protein n=1 Tax=Gilvimarinus gilvus TaxID=3058038 RepID=A0ABU4RUN6_9GAMM|nr:hypothetical protein [Gilvimarinus sp. SDUM040013]MDO3388556.1 hypothetical protein [Gilvimarinus sp. SDUM040013]MDX6848572.1 hypothetical protein [Gilvimarinus sp. SDUM040013]
MFSLAARHGHLRLYGRESMGSRPLSSLVAMRRSRKQYTAQTCIEFSPTSFQQMAGMTCYYHSPKLRYPYISCDDEGQRQLNIMSCLGNLDLMADFPIEPKSIRKPCILPISFDGRDWQTIDHTLDATFLSCEAGKGDGASFTRAFVGMACQDMTGMQKPADFTYFHYYQ